MAKKTPVHWADEGFPVSLGPTCGHQVLVPKVSDWESRWDTPGRWWIPKEGMVFVICPDCGSPLSLQSPGQKGHDIAPDGTVSPSVGCPQCGWHEFIKLEDWTQ